MADKFPALPELTLGDLLATFDIQLLYLLERRYLETLTLQPDSFANTQAQLDFINGFCGFRLRGLKSYGSLDRDLAAQNIENLLGLFRDGSHSFLLAMDGREKRIPELSFLTCRRAGAVAESAMRPADYAQILSRGLTANLPGASWTEYPRRDYVELADWAKCAPHVGILTGIPGRKRPDEKFFAQGIERFLDSVTGLDFTCLLVAEPYSTREISDLTLPALHLKNSVGQLRKFTVSDNQSVTDSLAHTLSVGINTALTKTAGTSLTDTTGQAGLGGAGYAGMIGSVVGGALGAFGGPAGIALGATIGSALGTAIGSAAGGAMSKFSSQSKTISDALSTMGGLSAGYARTRTRATTTGRTVTREAVNFSAEHALEILDNHLNRLKYARSYGFWNVGFYVFAPDSTTFTAVKNAALATFSGETTHFEPLRFVELRAGSRAHESALLEITGGCNPRLNLFEQMREVLPDGHHPLGKCFDGLSTAMTTGELAILAAPPQRECRALSVTERGVFGGCTLGEAGAAPPERALTLGRMLYYGRATEEQITVPLDTLTRHLFVTGITGSGKTNTVRGICERLSREKIPWLVIEPSAKTEYRGARTVDGALPAIFSLGTEGRSPAEKARGVGAPFRLNPFYFSRGVSLLTHLDHLKAAFTAAFPMYASMPYLLEEAIVAIYRDAGWDLADSTNLHASDPWSGPLGQLLFPTLSELHATIDRIVASKRYDTRLEMDLSAALRARISSLMLGAKGLMLDTRATLDVADLLDAPVVLELGAMGSDEEKVFVIALLVSSLTEVAAARGPSPDSALRHVLIIEEAHRLLRAAAPSDNPEIANVRGAAVEQFANLLSEMRAFGHGVVVVDQTPARLLPEVVKGTHLKIVHQLAAADDREAVGETMALDEAQIRDLARLRRDLGEAVVYQPEWEKAYCISVEKHAPAERSPADLASRRDQTIKSYASAYRGGSSSDDAALRAVIGVAADHFALFQSALGVPLQPSAIDIVLGPPAMAAIPVKADATGAFEQFLVNLMRINSARLSGLTECPEMFAQLCAELRIGGDARARFKALSKRLKEALPADALLRAAVRLYAEQKRLGEEPRRIAGAVEPGDACRAALRKCARQHTETILAGVEMAKDKCALIERLLVEQAVRLAGFGQVAEIVERCSRVTPSNP